MGQRIIGGRFRGRKLAAVRGGRIRPTADRTREAVFNILAGAVPRAEVLDLFAGTGAFGLEALSRGAARAVFVDRHPGAVALISRNVQALGLEAHARVILWDAARNLNCLASLAFDLVFMDPPYQQHLVSPALANLTASGALKPGARVVVEHALRDPLGEPPPGLRLQDQRKYGNTLVSILDYVV